MPMWNPCNHRRVQKLSCSFFSSLICLIYLSPFDTNVKNICPLILTNLVEISSSKFLFTWTLYVCAHTHVCARHTCGDERTTSEASPSVLLPLFDTGSLTEPHLATQVVPPVSRDRPVSLAFSSLGLQVCPTVHSIYRNFIKKKKTIPDIYSGWAMFTTIKFLICSI